MHCVDFFLFLVGVVKICPYKGHFSRIYRSKLSIYLQNYVKNGLIFKTTNQIFFFFNTVHNLITFSIVFTNKNRGGGHFEPPPPLTNKGWKHPNTNKVKGVQKDPRTMRVQEGPYHLPQGISSGPWTPLALAADHLHQKLWSLSIVERRLELATTTFYEILWTTSTLLLHSYGLHGKKV